MRRRWLLLGLAFLFVPGLYSQTAPKNVAVDQAGEDRPPPLFAYTQRVEADGIPVLTMPFRRTGNKTDTIVEVLSGTDYVFRVSGGRISRGHFLHYVESQTTHPVLVCADGQFPEAKWLTLFNSQTYVVLLRRDNLPCRFGREPKKSLPPELGCLTAGANGGEPVVVRARAAEKKEALPAEDLAGAKENPEGRERYALKPALTRYPVKGLTAKTVKGTAVDLEQLAKTATDKPIPVALLHEGEDLDPFWKPVLKPESVVVHGIPRDPATKK